MNIKAFIKKIIISVLIGLGLGLIIGISFIFVDEDQIDAFKTIAILFIVLLTISRVAYIILSFMKSSKEMKRLIKLLSEDFDLERYINETQVAITKTKNKSLKLYFALNLAVGYSSKGQYQKAIDYMLNLNVKDSSSTIKALYYNNLTFYYCELGKLEAALKTFSIGERFINKTIKNIHYSASMLHTKGLLEYLKGNLSESEELFEKSKVQVMASNHLIASSNLYLARIYMQTNRLAEAKLLLNYNSSQKLFPTVLSETERTLKELQSLSEQG